MPGDFAKLHGLQQSLRELSQVPSKVAGRAAYKIGEIVQQEFDAGRDPYGNAWAPLAASTLKSGRSPPPLTKTGSMRGGTRVFAGAGAGIQVEVPFPGAIHQWSRRALLPQRHMIPSTTLPASWRRAVTDAANVEMKLKLKR